MGDNILSKRSLEEIRKIHGLSLEYNNKLDKKHTERLMELMREHIDEIEELLRKGDPHALIETGDLIILCFEMLVENNVSIGDTISTCIGRYKTKLSKLLSEVDPKGGMKCQGGSV